MKTDYILIAIDPQSRYAIRFASLKNIVKDSINLHGAKDKLRETLASFLLGSVILGSRSDEQESTLYQLKFTNSPIYINCEVSPRGPLRSAIFPTDKKDQFVHKPKGHLNVVHLKKEDQIYKSVIEIENGDIEKTFKSYLQKSTQNQSVFFSNQDVKDHKNNFALWVEKLPDTSIKDWNKFKSRFDHKNFFIDSFKESDDPDKIIQHLFPETIRILTVTKPRLQCSCSKERILEALALLPHEDLVDSFMEGQGLETHCDYCHKKWIITDQEIRNLIKASSSIH